MKVVVTELQTACQDKKRNSDGLLDDSLCVNGRVNKQAKTQSLNDSRLKKPSQIPTAGCFSARHLQPSFFECKKKNKNQAKRMRDDWGSENE
jgi:hypothetical protein